MALTQLQEAFCQEFVATGGNRTEAAERAGYQGGRNACSVAGARLITQANIQQRIFELTRERFVADAPTGRAVMLELATTAKSELVRFHAAKDLLDRAGHQPTQVIDVRKSLAPSDVQALEDRVRQLVAALGITAIDVTPTALPQHSDKTVERPES